MQLSEFLTEVFNEFLDLNRSLKFFDFCYDKLLDFKYV